MIECFVGLFLNVVVLGATGNIGGTLSHEYLLPSPIGEDTILTCNRYV